MAKYVNLLLCVGLTIPLITAYFFLFHPTTTAKEARYSKSLRTKYNNRNWPRTVFGRNETQRNNLGNQKQFNNNKAAQNLNPGRTFFSKGNNEVNDFKPSVNRNQPIESPVVYTSTVSTLRYRSAQKGKTADSFKGHTETMNSVPNKRNITFDTSNATSVLKKQQTNLQRQNSLQRPTGTSQIEQQQNPKIPVSTQVMTRRQSTGSLQKQQLGSGSQQGNLNSPLSTQGKIGRQSTGSLQKQQLGLGSQQGNLNSPISTQGMIGRQSTGSLQKQQLGSGSQQANLNSSVSTQGMIGRQSTWSLQKQQLGLGSQKGNLNRPVSTQGMIGRQSTGSLQKQQLGSRSQQANPNSAVSTQGMIGRQKTGSFQKQQLGSGSQQGNPNSSVSTEGMTGRQSAVSVQKQQLGSGSRQSNPNSPVSTQGMTGRQSAVSVQKQQLGSGSQQSNPNIPELSQGTAGGQSLNPMQKQPVQRPVGRQNLDSTQSRLQTKLNNFESNKGKTGPENVSYMKNQQQSSVLNQNVNTQNGQQEANSRQVVNFLQKQGLQQIQNMNSETKQPMTSGRQSESSMQKQQSVLQQ